MNGVRVLPFVTSSVFAVLASMAASCVFESESNENTSQTAMSVYVPKALDDDIELLRLTVFDDDASCNGFEIAGGTPLTGLENIEFGLFDTQSITVSAGLRVFSLLALAADVVIARGCSEEIIVDDEDRNVIIELQEVPGRPDAGL